MPLYAVERVLDPAMSEVERRGQAVRMVVSIPFIPGVYWLRSYVIDTPERWESFCLYEGPSAEVVAYYSSYCRLPFTNVWEIAGADPDDEKAWPPHEGTDRLLMIRNRAQDQRGGFKERIGDLPGVQWTRTYQDEPGDRVTTVLRAAGGDGVRANPEQTTGGAIRIDEVIEAHPRDLVEVFESYGVPKYWEQVPMP